MSIVGIDIGGTSVRQVVLREDGTVVARGRLSTAPERGAQQTLDAIIRATHELASTVAADPVQAIGLGVTGPVDVVTGIVSNPFTLGGWPPTDLRTPFSAAFGVPAVIDNDANVAAVGEWWQGAGRGAGRMVMVTIGTGIGVAILIEGKLQRSSRGVHGEAGHMVLNPSGELCYCGARGCWEVLASGSALDRHARALAADGGLAGLLDNAALADSTVLFRAAAAGDAAARQAIESVARWWGLGLVNLASTVMPDLFVLSGGVMEHFDVVRPTIEGVLKQHAIMVPTDVPLAVAALGDDAGAVGAAKLALDLLRPPSPPFAEQ